jgi:2'-5' RNA ligase
MVIVGVLGGLFGAFGASISVDAFGNGPDDGPNRDKQRPTAMDYYCLVFYPQLETERIDQIRRRYDPTVHVIRPHVTIVFPVPETVGEAKLIRHVESVLSDWSPFEIRLGGFHKSHDHWLFLTLAEGGHAVKRLYRSLYTGILAEYRRDDIEFLPHLGLGLFVKDGSKYDWDNPQQADFDQEQYEQALREANTLRLDSTCTVDKLHLVKISGEVLDWATGKRASIPEGSQALEVREFRLRDRGA